MTVLVLVILALIWVAVLLPPYLQHRSESRPADSISSFQHQLSVLEQRAITVNPALRARRHAPGREVVPLRGVVTAPGRPSGAPIGRADARRRRRDVFFTLAAAAGLTFVLALVQGGPVWKLHLACDALLAVYVYLLAQAQQRTLERSTKVRYLPSARRADAGLMLRRSGT
ncbi:MAG: hypothetical protein ACT4PW_10245 [Acidimicrobiia bacterium]